MTIRGYAARAAGARLAPFEYEPDPAQLGPAQIEIKITHCGVCHTDVHLLNNDWGFTQYPFVPGHEVVGTVTKAGRDVRTLTEGQRVGVGWESGSCGICEWCAHGEENLCLQWRGTCTHGFGGYASDIRVDGKFAVPIPDGLSSESAAPMFCGGIAVYAPLAQEVRSSMKVAVVGVGGLGHLALQFARAFGCEVTAISTSPAKEAEARRFGAHAFVDSRDPAAMEKCASSFDVIISTVSADLDWPQYINALKPKGKLCIAGVPTNEIRIPAFPLILGRKSVFGTPVGGPSLIREMLEFAERNRIEPMTESLPMSQVNEAMERVRRNEARYRMVLVN